MSLLVQLTIPQGKDPNNYPEYLWWCPGCKCAHFVNVNRGSVRWEFNGNFESPTVNPSILVTGQKRCHVFIRDGMIQYLSDCTHELAGQTVPMKNWQCLGL